MIENEPATQPAPPSLGKALLLSPLTALKFQIIFLPAELGRSVGLSRRTLIAVTVMVFTVFGGVAIYGMSQKVKERKGNTAVKLWQDFDRLAGMLDEEKMREILDRIRHFTPNDPQLAPRVTAMETLNADPTDQVMVLYCMNKNRQKNNTDDAVREALKRLEYSESDWQSRCLLAEYELRRGDKAKAAEHLKHLPAPTAATPPIGPWQLLNAIELHKTLELPYENLQEFLIFRMLPIAKNTHVISQLQFGDKFQLFNCYMHSFTYFEKHQDILSLWVPYSNVVRSLLDEKDTPSPILDSTAMLEIRQFLLLEELISKKLFPEEEVTGLREEMEDRLERTWAAMRTKDSNDPMGYLGPAQIHFFHKRNKEALEAIDEGLRICGDKPELLKGQTVLLREIDPRLGLLIANRAAERNPTNLNLAILLVETAMKLGETEIALQGCEKIRAIDPNLFWVRRMEASIYLDKDRASKVIEILVPVMDQVLTDPPAIALYVKALCKSGANEEVRKFIDELMAKAKAPELCFAALLAAYEKGLTEIAIGPAEKLASQWPDFIPAWKLVGDAHTTLAEPTPEKPRWDPDQARLAVRAYEKQLAKEPNALNSINNTVWLQVKALGQNGLAERNAIPLKEAEQRGELSASRRETLALLYLATDRLTEAKNILESIVRIEQKVPSYYIHLGIVYSKLGRQADAESCFAKAGALPKAAWESVELESALKTLRKEN